MSWAKGNYEKWFWDLAVYQIDVEDLRQLFTLFA